ncbi:MAG: hypothetical protein ACRETX_17295, partial [Steroidobacteraceae bacterium]
MRPNILLIVDTSGSMDALVSTGKSRYDPARVYAGSCTADRVYFRRGPGEPPKCNTDDFVRAVDNACRAASSALAGDAGLWTGKALQWNRSRKRWVALRDEGGGDGGGAGGDQDPHVECETDAGTHGKDGSSTSVWARNGKEFGWTTDPNKKISWNSANVYTLYSAN